MGGGGHAGFGSGFQVRPVPADEICLREHFHKTRPDRIRRYDNKLGAELDNLTGQQPGVRAGYEGVNSKVFRMPRNNV